MARPQCDTPLVIDLWVIGWLVDWLHWELLHMVLCLWSMLESVSNVY